MYWNSTWGGTYKFTVKAHTLSTYCKNSTNCIRSHTCNTVLLNLTFSLQFSLCFIKANIPSRLSQVLSVSDSAWSHIHDKETYHRNVLMNYSHINLEYHRPFSLRVLDFCNLISIVFLIQPWKRLMITVYSQNWHATCETVNVFVFICTIWLSKTLGEKPTVRTATPQ